MAQKTAKYGIRVTALTLRATHNRYKYVEMGNFKSQLQKITCNFSGFSTRTSTVHSIHEYCEISKTLKTTLFADDTNILCDGDNFETLL